MVVWHKIPTSPEKYSACETVCVRNFWLWSIIYVHKLSITCATNMHQTFLGLAIGQLLWPSQSANYVLLPLQSASWVAMLWPSEARPEQQLSLWKRISVWLQIVSFSDEGNNKSNLAANSELGCLFRHSPCRSTVKRKEAIALEKKILSMGVRCITIQADLSNSDEIKSIFKLLM